MKVPWETIHDFHVGRDRLRAARYGVIETSGGVFQAVHLRLWPKLFSLTELWPIAFRYHARGQADRCLLYYNQPRGQANFLALKYVVSTAGTTYQTFRASLTALDAIAEIKHTDAIVCDAANWRISDRLLARLGWEPLAPSRWHRNYIRRFYGEYPAVAVSR
jgi:hypothetical protein